MRFLEAATRASLAVVALVGAGCDLAITDPGTENPIQVKVDFCSNELPVWFAHQSSGGAWTVIEPDGFGTYTFNATARATIAYVRQNGADYRTDIIYTSNLDLEAMSGLSCVEEGGVKQVNGSVSGHTGEQLALVGMSFSSAYLPAAQSTFTLTQLVDRPIDLIASRVEVIGDEQQANKTVIRRAQSPTSGSTMTPINFDTDGFVPVSNVASVIGVSTVESAFLMNNFFSQLETSHTLTFVDGIADGAVPFVSIPSSDLSAGDYHDLFVVATTTTGSMRGTERYFRNPANQTLSLGPFLAEPFVAVLATTPYVRFRVQLGGQVDYSTMVTADFHQQTSFSSIDVSMSVTASYFGGTPVEWNLPMPNFSGLPDWDNSWGLKTGVIDWSITAFYGRPQLILGAKPDDPETVQFAGRSGSITAVPTAIVAAPASVIREQRGPAMRAVPRPRHFSRRQ